MSKHCLKFSRNGHAYMPPGCWQFYKKCFYQSAVHLSRCNFLTAVAKKEILSVLATTVWVVPDAQVKPCVSLQARAGLALWPLWRTHSAVQGDSRGEAPACPKPAIAALGLYILCLCHSAAPNQGPSSLLMLDRQENKGNHKKKKSIKMLFWLQSRASTGVIFWYTLRFSWKKIANEFHSQYKIPLSLQWLWLAK